MARSLGIAVIVLATVAAALASGSPAAAAGGESLTAVYVAQNMDKSKYSSAEIKSFLKDLKGKRISAHGKVDEILTGKTGTRVVVFINVPGKSSHFVVDVMTTESKNLHKGDTVSCTGEYAKYNMFTLNGIGIKGSCSK